MRVNKAALRKKIMELVDPQIGPEFSVGHLKPSDLSPESSMKKAIRTISNQIAKALKKIDGRVGADGSITPVRMPKPGTPGTGVPASYDFAGRPKFNYPSAADTRYNEGSRVGYDKATAKKNIVGLSGHGGAGAKSGRIRNPNPHGRMMTAARERGIGYYSGREGGGGTKAPKMVPAKTYHSPEGFSGRTPSREAIGRMPVGEGPRGKGYAKACSPCEVRKAVTNAVKAAGKKKAKIPSEAHSEHVYESYGGVKR